jgi:hypothetical protein
MNVPATPEAKKAWFEHMHGFSYGNSGTFRQALAHRAEFGANLFFDPFAWRTIRTKRGLMSD